MAVGKIKFLKLTVKRPVVSFIEGLSALSSKNYNNLCFSLSFLSIMGYDVAKLPSGIEKRCKELSRKASLTVLSKLFNESFISTMNKLANEPSFVSRIKNNFKQIASLMDQYGDLVSSINYIMAANNEELGDWMIEYFLTNGIKDGHAKLISQILLCNASKTYDRLQTILKSVLKQIGEVKGLGIVPEGVIILNRLFPFIENFCTSIDASLNSLGQRGSLL